MRPLHVNFVPVHNGTRVEPPPQCSPGRCCVAARCGGMCGRLACPHSAPAPWRLAAPKSPPPSSPHSASQPLRGAAPALNAHDATLLKHACDLVAGAVCCRRLHALGLFRSGLRNNGTGNSTMRCRRLPSPPTQPTPALQTEWGTVPTNPKTRARTKARGGVRLPHGSARTQHADFGSVLFLRLHCVAVAGQHLCHLVQSESSPT